MHTQFNRSVKLTAAAAAVVAGILSISSPALAQQRVGSDGRLRDANNLIGSGGSNGGGNAAAYYSNAVNNSIVSGDVTGGKAFHGNLGFEDPTSFRGSLPGSNLSNFIAESSGVTTSGVLTDNANQTRIYLGDNRGVNAPSSFVSLGNNGGYVQTGNVDTSAADGRLGDPAAMPSGAVVPQSLYLPAGTQAGGGRSAYVTASPLYGVQKLDAAQQAEGTQQNSNQQAQAIGGTPLDSRLDDTAMTRLDALNEGFNADLTPGSFNQSSNPQALGGPNTAQSAINQQQGLPPLNNSASDQLNAGNSDQNNPNGNNQPNSGAANSNPSNPNAQNPIGQNANGMGNSVANSVQGGAALNIRPLDRPVNAAVPAGNMLTGSTGDQRLGASVNTGENSQTNLLNVSRASAGQQSAYFRMLRQLQAQGGNGALTPQQQKMLKDYKAAADSKPEVGDTSHTAAAGRSASGLGMSGVPANGTPPPIGSGTGAAGSSGAGVGGSGVGGSGAGGTGSSIGGGTGAVTPQQIATPKEQQGDIVIPSFAREETDKTLVPILAKAEELMKQGKFSSAVDQYDQAEQAAPNDPFIWLGRANAELGTTSYGLAEQHLRRAFMSDQALLMARYDLSELLGNERLQYLIRDLKEIAAANPNEPRPVFLLAYICYNTNKDRAAANYLNLAAKREGKPDPLYKLLQQRWDLPDVGTDDSELNK